MAQRPLVGFDVPVEGVDPFDVDLLRPLVLELFLLHFVLDLLELFDGVQVELPEPVDRGFQSLDFFLIGFDIDGSGEILILGGFGFPDGGNEFTATVSGFILP